MGKVGISLRADDEDANRSIERKSRCDAVSWARFGFLFSSEAGRGSLESLNSAFSPRQLLSSLKLNQNWFRLSRFFELARLGLCRDFLGFASRRG